MDNVIIIALLLAIAIGLLLYLFLVPRNVNSFSPEIDKKDKKMRMLAALSDEFNNSLPLGVGPMQNKKEYPKIESLIRRAGNPWNLTAQEFVFTQWTFALIGFVLGWVAWGVIQNFVAVPWFIVVAALTVLMFFYPKSKYSEQAKKRDLEFKRQLPEALDLMIISLSAGTTFSQALRDSIPNMPDGILKDEFLQIEKNLRAGKSLDEALTAFGERAPNESINSFIKAVKEATKLDVPVIEILEARSAASRQDFFSLIYEKTAKLESKMMMVLTPTLIGAVLIIAILPSIISLVDQLGGGNGI